MDDLVPAYRLEVDVFVGRIRNLELGIDPRINTNFDELHELNRGNWEFVIRNLELGIGNQQKSIEYRDTDIQILAGELHIKPMNNTPVDVITGKFMYETASWRSSLNACPPQARHMRVTLSQLSSLLLIKRLGR